MATPPAPACRAVDSSRQRISPTAILFGLFAGAAYGSVGVVAKLAFRDSLTTSTILAARLSLGAAAIWLLARAFGSIQPLPIRRLLSLLAIGAVCFYGQSLFIFLSVERIPATTMEFVLYTYPALVAIAAAVFFRERFSRRGIGALAASLIGLALLLGSPGSAATSIGGALAFGGAVATTAYLLLLRIAGQDLPPLQVSALILSGAAVAAWIGGLSTDTVHVPSRRVDLLWLLLHAALIATAVSASIVALQKMGAVKTAVTGTFEPVTTAVLATLVLAERLSALQAFGGFLVIAAALALALERGQQTPNAIPHQVELPFPEIEAWDLQPTAEGERQ